MRVNVTKPYLPNKKKLWARFNSIYESVTLTNYGPQVNQLENRLKKRFGVKHVICVANGTMAMQIAIKSLNLKKKEIITSPFSYIATTSAIIWEGFSPRFVDIDPLSLNLSANLIEKKVNKNTSCILGIHAFGNPNDVQYIEKIKKRNDLKLIYDASHCFDVNYKNKSLFHYGDISTISFHATKIFHTIEGGAIFTNNTRLAKRIRSMINFGIEANKIQSLGINAKMNEFEAAMGLSILDEIDIIKMKRKKIFDYYFKHLSSKFQFQQWSSHSQNNFAYVPILFESEKKLLKSMKILNQKQIYPRRYFYPSLNLLKIHNSQDKCPIAESISKKILCLPIYHDLKMNQVNDIIRNLISL